MIEESEVQPGKSVFLAFAFGYGIAPFIPTSSGLAALAGGLLGFLLELRRIRLGKGGKSA